MRHWRRLAWLMVILIGVSACASAQLRPDNEVGPPRPAGVPEEGPLVLSVEEAVALALQNNPGLLAEQQNPLVAGAFARVERARFDPLLFARYDRLGERTQQQFANTGNQLDIVSDSESYTVGANQYLPTGTTVELTFSQLLSESNRAPTQADARVGLTLTQALLRGAGIGANLVSLRQANVDVAASAYQLRGYVSQLVADVENLYWEYRGAREQERILGSSLELAERQVEQTQRQIEAGSVARTEIAAARAEAARRQQALIDGSAAAERIRNNLLARIFPGEPFGRTLQATSQIEIDSVDASDTPETAEHAALAQARRAQLNEARLQLARNELEVVATRNGLLPRLDLFLTLGQTGFAQSFGDARGRLDDTESYDLQGAVEFEYPLGNRAARADDDRARFEVRQAEASIDNLSRLIVAEVQNAVVEVRRAASQIEATAATVSLQEEVLNAEQLRFEVGRSTALLVAQAQRDLLEAQLSRAAAIIDYRQSLIDLYRLDGSLLTRRLIDAPGELPPKLDWQ